MENEPENKHSFKEKDLSQARQLLRSCFIFSQNLRLKQNLDAYKKCALSLTYISDILEIADAEEMHDGMVI